MSKGSEQRRIEAYWEGITDRAEKHLLCAGYRRAKVDNRRLGEVREQWVRIVNAVEVRGVLAEWIAGPYGFRSADVAFHSQRMEGALRQRQALKTDQLTLGLEDDDTAPHLADGANPAAGVVR